RHTLSDTTLGIVAGKLSNQLGRRPATGADLTSRNVRACRDVTRRGVGRRIVIGNTRFSVVEVLPERHIGGTTAAAQECRESRILTENAGLEQCGLLFGLLQHVREEDFRDDSVRKTGNSHCLDPSWDSR